MISVLKNISNLSKRVSNPNLLPLSLIVIKDGLSKVETMLKTMNSTISDYGDNLRKYNSISSIVCHQDF